MHTTFVSAEGGNEPLLTVKQHFTAETEESPLLSGAPFTIMTAATQHATLFISDITSDATTGETPDSFI